MKIFLNLLSEEKKNKIKNDRRFKLIVWQEMILVFLVVFFALMLASTNFVLKVELDGMEAVAKLEKEQGNYRELQGQEDAFQKVNAKLAVLGRLEKFNLHWTDVLSALDAVTIEGILVTELATDNLQMTLIGKAKTRDNLLKFKENIENSECFADAKIPLSDLVKKEDVEFQVDFLIEEKCIRRLN